MNEGPKLKEDVIYNLHRIEGLVKNNELEEDELIEVLDILRKVYEP